MSTSVYVWPRERAYVGHASMLVGEHVLVEPVYISFWPADAAGKKDVLGQTHAPHYPGNYSEDQRAEGGRTAKVVALESLNEEAVLEGWKEIKEKGTRYNLQKYNCSTVVSQLLMRGSGNTYSKKPEVEVSKYVTSTPVLFMVHLVYGRTVEVWTPEHVLEYAREIRMRELTSGTKPRRPTGRGR